MGRYARQIIRLFSCSLLFCNCIDEVFFFVVSINQCLAKQIQADSAAGGALHGCHSHESAGSEEHL
jgi:hypothetical protein